MTIYAEDYEDDEDWARDYIQAMIDQGHAVAMANAFSEHSQSCHYVWGIVQAVAMNTSDEIHPNVKTFAANLLDDWSK